MNEYEDGDKNDEGEDGRNLRNVNKYFRDATMFLLSTDVNIWKSTLGRLV